MYETGSQPEPSKTVPESCLTIFCSYKFCKYSSFVRQVVFVWGNVLAFNFHCCIPTARETTTNQNITQLGFMETWASCMGFVRWVSTHSTNLLTPGRQNVKESCSVKCRDETVEMFRILSCPRLFVTEAVTRPVVRGSRFQAFCRCRVSSCCAFVCTRTCCAPCCLAGTGQEQNDKNFLKYFPPYSVTRTSCSPAITGYCHY